MKMGKWKSLKEMISYSEGGIFSRVLSKGKSQLTLFCIAEGTEISEHTSTREGFVHVIEGRGVFTLAGEEIRMLPGVIIFLSKNIRHSLKAEENTSFLLLLSE